MIAVAPHTRLKCPSKWFRPRRRQAHGVASALLVVAGEASQCQILERCIGTGQTLSTPSPRSCSGPAPSSTITRCRKNLPKGSTSPACICTGRGAATFPLTTSPHGAIVRNDIVAVLDARHDCTLNGVYLGSGKQLIDNHDHRPRAAEPWEPRSSGASCRPVAGGVHCKIVVRIDAQKTDAKQTNKALLLSDDATINTKPQLEISRTT